MSKSVLWPTAAWVFGVSVLCLACSPKTGTVDGNSQDLGMQARDLGMCASDPLNQLQNPGFETPSVEPDGNGKAVNTGMPASSIPGKWDGCCNQAGGGTAWLISTTMPRCGLRSLTVTSTAATANVLNQTLQVPTLVGKSLRASAYVFVSQVGTGGKIQLDVWDLGASKVIASSPTITTTTPDWQRLDLSVPVPSGGNVQLRINSSGTINAVVDDPSVLIQ
jgi:hypothetical protein